MGDELWSGWGVRTMSTGDAGYNPLAYHNGTVWPHDNSLIAWGLARYGRWPEAQRIVQRMLQAAALLRHQLPEVFAGFRAPRRRSRSRTRPRPARRPGPPGRRCCCCRCCSASSPTAGGRRSRRWRRRELPSWAGSTPPDGRARVRPPVGRARSRTGASASRRRDAGRGVAASSPASGSRFRRPATAASSGSSRCSPTGSSTRATTSRCSPRATRARRRSSRRVFPRRRASRSGTTYSELRHALCLLRARGASST